MLGMHCSACSTAVETALGARKGVQKATVSLTLKMAEVTHDPQVVDEVRPGHRQLFRQQCRALDFSTTVDTVSLLWFLLAAG